MNFQINKKNYSLNILIHYFKYKNMSKVTNISLLEWTIKWPSVTINIIASHCLLPLLLIVVGSFPRCSVKLCRCNASDVGFHLLCPDRRLEAE